MKKSKFMLLMSLILCFSFIFGTAAFAVEPDIAASEQAIVSVQASDAPKALVQFLEENNVAVAENSTIELRPAKDPEGVAPDAIAVCTSTRTGTRVVEDVLLAVAKDGESQAKLNEDITAVARSSSFGIPVDYQKTGFLIQARAVLDVYYYDPLLAEFYDPWGCYFTYTKTSDNVTVSFVQISYITTGALYTYPEYQNTGIIDTHYVIADKSSPTAGEMYYSINHMSSNRLIDPSVGSAGTYGMSLDFSVTANGVNQGYNVNLRNWQDLIDKN